MNEPLCINALLATTPITQLDAEILLADVLNLTRGQLRAYPEYLVTPEKITIFQSLIQRRLMGEPVAYLLGKKEFWSLLLTVSPATLIPRPETELLVEQILARFPADKTLQLADLGTGSGAIALALAKERPAWNIWATDINPHTLQIAQQNAQQHHVANIHFQLGDWFNALPMQLFDVIVSNPPYIAQNDPHLASKELQHEPLFALISGHDGLCDLTHIISCAPNYLKPDGWLFLEHGYNQNDEVSTLLTTNGYVNLQTYRDLAGHPRATIGQIKNHV